jgi:hypothetical protein
MEDDLDFLFPMFPLYTKITGAQPQGTKRSAAIAAHINEAVNEDQGEGSGGSGPGPRKVVTPIGRHTTRSSFLASLRPQQCRRVGDGLEAAEAAPDERWVAVGEVSPLQ